MPIPERTIHVTFAANGTLEVDPDIEAVLEDGCIFWHVHSKNMLVRFVEIRFESRSAFFFCKDLPGSKTCSTQIRRELPPYGPGYADLVIWGQAPDPGGALRSDKYSVLGYDAMGDVVAEEDPRIITTKP